VTNDDEWNPNVPPEVCSRCEKPFEDSHPWALGVVDVHTPLAPADWQTGRTFICAACVPVLAEFLVPAQCDRPGWTAEKDQYNAHVRAYQESRRKGR
jgi:hypothetical protein